MAKVKSNRGKRARTREGDVDVTDLSEIDNNSAISG